MTKAQREARKRSLTYKSKRKGHKHPGQGRRNPSFQNPLSDEQLIDIVFNNALASLISTLVPREFKREIIKRMAAQPQSANADHVNPRDSTEKSAETK